ncbi:MAG: 50S ribosomal protein L9 [Bacteroidales bacterium]|nr:50S ribosomal protein L9 [Bacteroidales bacterium]
MEVILTQDVAKLGYKDDIVKVKNGYANNFLFPKGLAVMATTAMRKIHAENMKQRSFKEEKLKIEAEKLGATLSALTVTVGAKAGASGKIFGSVNAIQVAEALKEQHNIDIDRRKITVEDIKEIGTHKAKANLHRDVKVEFTVEVVGE